MIQRIQLLRNIGQFDSVQAAANLPLARLTLVYSENGRGKTTLAAVLRSLASGDPLPIAERRRLAAVQAPHIVIDAGDGQPAMCFRTTSGVARFRNWSSMTTRSSTRTCTQAWLWMPTIDRTCMS